MLGPRVLPRQPIRTVSKCIVALLVLTKYCYARTTLTLP